MKLRMIEMTVGRTIPNEGNSFGNIKPSLTLGVEIEDGDNIKEVRETLQARALEMLDELILAMGGVAPARRVPVQVSLPQHPPQNAWAGDIPQLQPVPLPVVPQSPLYSQPPQAPAFDINAAEAQMRAAQAAREAQQHPQQQPQGFYPPQSPQPHGNPGISNAGHNQASVGSAGPSQAPLPRIDSVTF